MRLLPLRFPYFWLAVGWVMVIGIIIATQLPSRDLPNLHMSDKLEHSGVYAILTLWFTGMYGRERYTLIAALFFAMGVLGEIFQYLLHLGRTADVLDALANTLGIVFAIGLSLIGVGGWMQRVENWFVKS